MAIMQLNQIIELYGVFLHLLLRIKFLTIGRSRLQNGMLKMIINGKQKILIDSSMTLRRHMMRKLVWKIKQMISKIKVKRHLDFINRTFYGKK